ncbi:MAG TPA: hypothetical protein VN671_13400 [Solirubrobacterales bacterium]|nr:hypothetical protein [Solirubrobacterales bacterium]
MFRNRHLWWTLSALALAGALLAACGGGNSTSTTAASDREAEVQADAPASTREVAVVKTMTTKDPARVVVDTEGRTVYEFRRDNPMLYQFSRDPVPTCYGSCSHTWIPLLTADRPKATGGAKPAMLGTIRRRDGGIQVTYDGHPLYLFTGDRRPGEMNGQGVHSFGAGWHAVEADGDEM